MKTLQSMSLAQLKQELIRLYDGNAGEMYYSLLEMGLSKSMMKKALIKWCEKETN
tara:strand:+ start:504 stop:668 length:165 start_codon:yes stop_codon:yes gene_type:complete